MLTNNIEVWSLCSRYVSCMLRVCVCTSGRVKVTCVHICGKYHLRYFVKASTLCGRSSRTTSCRASAHSAT